MLRDFLLFGLAFGLLALWLRSLDLAFNRQTPRPPRQTPRPGNVSDDEPPGRRPPAPRGLASPAPPPRVPPCCGGCRCCNRSRM